VDCERFDQDQLGLLYEELDEVSASALRRHIAHCPRCQEAWQRLVRVREASRIPLESAGSDFVELILQKEVTALRAASLRERMGRTVSVLAEYAMRPQLAMAALLVLMVGTSLVFVRSGPGLGDQVAVREVGSPEAERPLSRPLAEAEPIAPLPFERAEAARAEPSLEGPDAKPRAKSLAAASSGAPVLPPTYEEAMRAYQDGRYAEAERLFSEVSKSGGEKAGSAALHEAHAARNGSGCQRAASYYDEVALRFAGSSVADEAAWHAALCYRALGQMDRARAQLEKLEQRPAYRARVERLLAPSEPGPLNASAEADAAGARAAQEPTPAASAPAASNAARAKATSAPAAKTAPAAPPESTKAVEKSP